MTSINQERVEAERRFDKMREFWGDHVIGKASKVFGILNEQGEVDITMPYVEPNVVEGEEEQEGDEIVEDDHGVRCRVDTEGRFTPVEPHCGDCDYVVDSCECQWEGDVVGWFQVDKELYDLAEDKIPVAHTIDEGERMYFLGCVIMEGFYCRCLEPIVDKL